MSRSIIITLKVSREFNEMVEIAARAMGVSKSELIRRAVQYYLKEVVWREEKPFVTPRMKIY